MYTYTVEVRFADESRNFFFIYKTDEEVTKPAYEYDDIITEACYWMLEFNDYDMFALVKDELPIAIEFSDEEVF